MPKFIPYLCLTCIGIPLLVWVVVKTGQKGYLTFYLHLAGTGYYVEYVILVLFKCYQYMPQILRNTYYDNILGAVFSNLIYVPVFATLTIAFRLRWLWDVLFIGLFILVELIFLRLHVYELYWWKVPYTCLLMVVLFVYARVWIKTLHDRSGAKRHVVTLLSATFSLVATTDFLMGIADLRLFKVGWVPDPYQDSIALASLLDLVISAVIVSVVLYMKKWQGWLLSVLTAWTLDLVCWKLGYYVPLRNLVFVTLVQGVMVTAVYVALHYLNRWLIDLRKQIGNEQPASSAATKKSF